MLHLTSLHRADETVRAAPTRAMWIGVMALALLGSEPTRAGFVATTFSVAATVVAACRIDAKRVMASLEAMPEHAVACASAFSPYTIAPSQPVIAVERGVNPDMPLLIVTF